MSGITFSNKVAAVIVAAGASRRMQAIKQLLPWKRTTLLGHTISNLEKSGVTNIYVVLGAHQEEIKKTVDSRKIEVIYNKNWTRGMGTSIAAAITYFNDHKLQYDGLLIATCDQPLISLTHYKKLIKSCISTDRIVVSSFNNGYGIPVVFGTVYFKELEALQMDVGAKSIVNKHLDRIIQLDAPEAAIDLDTEQRYKHYYHTFGIES